MAVLDFITKEATTFLIKWIMNQGLAIAVMVVIIYFDREEKNEMKADINMLNAEMKLYLKTDRDTLIYVLKDVNSTLKEYKNVKEKR